MENQNVYNKKNGGSRAEHNLINFKWPKILSPHPIKLPGQRFSGRFWQLVLNYKN